MKTTIIGAVVTLAAASLTTSLAVQAEDNYFEPYNYFENNGYEDELQHCLDILRPNLGLTGSSNEKVSYEITEINFRSPWYRFEIVATVSDRAGQPSLEGFRVACKSNRRIESARLLERKNDATDYRALVVRNTSELVELQTDTAVAVKVNT